MPRRKQRGRPKKLTLRDRIASIRWGESYTSLLMGVVVVIVAVLFVVSFLKQTHHVQETSSTSTVANTVTSAPHASALHQSEKTYTVKSGDDLWHIAEKYYKSGYNWVDIAKANKLADPGTIHVGNVLTIPKVTPEIAAVTITPTPSQATIQTASAKAITGTTYTVQAGDDLWDIAVRSYADGYQWTKIAEANHLANPSLIFSGNVLSIPR